MFTRTATDLTQTGGAVFLMTATRCAAGLALNNYGDASGMGGVDIEGITFEYPAQNGSTIPTYESVGTVATAAGSKTITLAPGNAAPPVGSLVLGANIPPMATVQSVSGLAVTITLPVTGAGVTSPAMVAFWHPIAYPPLLANGPYSQLVDLTFKNNVVLNAYEFLQTSPTCTGAGDWRITENRIYAINRAFDLQCSVHESTEVADNLFTAGIYGSVAYAGSGLLGRWSQNNAEFVHVDVGSPATDNSVDGMTLIGNLVHGYRFGERVLSGNLNLTHSIGTDFDGVGTLLSVESAGAYVGEIIGGDHTLGTFDPVLGTFVTGLSEPGISFNTSGVVRSTITAANIGFAASDAIDVLGSGRAVVSVVGGKIENYGLDNASDDYGVRVANSAATVRVSTSFVGTGGGNQNGILINGVQNGLINGSTFDGMKTAVTATSGTTLVIVGNSASGSAIADYTAKPAGFTVLKPGAGTNSWN